MPRLSKNIIYNFVGHGLLIILGFVAVRFIFKQLGEDALGIIYFTAMLNSLLCAVLEMGICTTTVREVSAHYTTDPDYIRDLIRTGSLFYWGCYVVISFFIFFLAPTIVEKWINLTTMDVETATNILRILGITSFIALPKSFYVSLIRGIQRMEFNNAIDVTTTALQHFGTIFILAKGGNLFLVVCWFAGCYVLRVFTYIIVTSHFFSLISMVPGYSYSVVKKNAHFASRMIFISITGAIYSQADKLIISKLMSIGIVGYYSFAYSIASKSRLLTGSISQAAYPSLSALHRAEDREGLISQYHKLQDFLSFGLFPILAFIPFAFLPLMSYVFNEETAQLLLLPTTLLCIGFFINGTLTIPYIFSLSVGKPGIAARQHLYDFFITLPASVLLIYYFGLIGAGLSVIFFFIFRFIYSLPRICSECLKISVWRWYISFLRIFVLGGLTYGIAWIVIVLMANYSILYLTAGYLGASVFYLLGSYFQISVDLRKTLLARFKSIESLKFLTNKMRLFFNGL